MPPALRRGRSSPVATPSRPDWNADHSSATTDQLVGLSDAQLAAVDPLAVNLIVAREIASLEQLDVGPYQQQVNRWAHDFATRYLPYWQQSFQREPHCYLNDHRFFSVGMICQYLRDEIGVSYKTEQRYVERIRYTSPDDLFLNGVIDTLTGTCANIPPLAQAIAWRLGWPVSLACVKSHFVLRYDDGDAIFNYETTAPLDSGFSSPRDDELIADNDLPPAAISSGSDLRAVTPRERLGLFVGFRARHYRDLGNEHQDCEMLQRAEGDYLLARYLFPAQRVFNRELAFLTGLFSSGRFETYEAGHWCNYRHLGDEVGAHLQQMQAHRRPPERPEPDDSTTGSVGSSALTASGG